MLYFNEDGKTFKDFGYRYYDCGGCSKIYRKGDFILKKYYKETEYEYRLEQEVFHLLKEIDSPIMIKIYELLSKFYNYLNGKEDFCVDGYKAQYYEKDPVNVLLKEKDYLLESLLQIENLFDILSDYLIVISDFCFDNSVCTKDGIVIIDPDCYKRAFIMNEGAIYSSTKNKGMVPVAREDILPLNKEKLVDYFFSLMKTNILNLDYQNPDLQKLKDFYYGLKVNLQSNITDIISKELRFVKKPYEYFFHR